MTHTPATVDGGKALVVAAAAMLAAIGVLFIFSTGYVGEGFQVRANWSRQLLFLAFGAIAAWGVSRMDTRHIIWRWMVLGGYVVSVLLLLAVLLAGRRIGGARRWIQLGWVMLQPAEFAKLFTVLAGAMVFSGEFLRSRWRELLVGGVIFLVPMALMAAEPSYGNAFSLLPPLAVLIGTRFLPSWAWRLTLALTVLTAGAALYALHRIRSNPELLRPDEQVTSVNPEGQGAWERLFRGYHLKRIRSYLSANGGWNEQQALMTIAGGGLSGKGYLNGTMNKLGYLPRTVAPTDFIFAVLAEEGGFLYGVLPVISLYLLLYGSMLHCAAMAARRLDFNVGAAGCTLLATHTIVGIGMNLRLLPVIGLPLPLLSYGGSFTVATLLLIGSVLATRRQDDTAAANDPGNASWIFQLGALFKVTCRLDKA